MAQRHLVPNSIRWRLDDSIDPITDASAAVRKAGTVA